ncbi:MAG: M17 family metallopeptidase, partial [Solirubrobacteraceae bacterium]
PTRLADRARDLAEELDGVTIEVLDEAELAGRGMGAFAAVARGSREPAQLITLRYDGPGARGPLTGWVGKAVTFDSGGISLKRGETVDEMKFDMSGGAAVIEALAAVARLALPVRLLAVAGATENMPDGSATRPGDIVRALDGTTVEIINTDAEGRLVLADCLLHTIAQGAERIVDIATLTGTIVTAFGGRFGGLMANDERWADRVLQAGEASGERVWRLPLDPWFAKQLEGRYADIVNARHDNRAATIIAGEFLARFVGDVPWAHIDTLAWDMERPYAKQGGAGFGVRLLVELASALAQDDQSPTTRSRR